MMLDKIFKLTYYNTTVKKEIIAACITFFTTIYIIFVNSIILSQSGLNIDQVFISTCLIIFFSGIIIAFFTNTPFMMGPGLGLNAMFVYDIVVNKGYSYTIALLTVFLSGLLSFIFFLFVPTKSILRSIPDNLKTSVIAGTGLFLVLIGLKLCGITIPNINTFGKLGNIISIPFIFGLLGFFILYICYTKNIKLFPVLTIIIFIVSIFINLIFFKSSLSLLDLFHFSNISSYTIPFFPLDLSAFKLPLLSIVISLFLASNCDSLGTYITCKTTLDNSSKPLPLISSDILLKKLMLIKSFTTMLSGLIGCSNTSLFLESTAGINGGGRTGLVALTIAILFLAALTMKPLLAIIPDWSSGPILLVIGLVIFIFNVKNINWEDHYTNYIPAFLSLFFIPITFSISNGLAIGLLSYIILKILSGKIKEIGVLSFILGIIFFVYLLI